MRVNAYWWGEGGIVELGVASEEDIESLIARAQIVSDETAGFGFYRTKDDFAEFCLVSESEFMLHSDALFRKPGLWGWLTSKGHINRILPDFEQTSACARDYFRLSREVFEQKYR